jgi:imidazolonepropionase
MLIHSASQLLTLAGGPQRGPSTGELGIIHDGAVLVQDGAIVAVGTTSDLLKDYPHEMRLDAHGKVVMPGFIDPHTHLVWAGDRAGEFEQRLQGKSYLEILAEGGGILSTVKATRQASFRQLVTETRMRATALFSHGTTTTEAKTGYGLDNLTELRLLNVLLSLDKTGPLEIIPTYLGAHAVPPEFQDNPDGYTTLLCDSLILKAAGWWRQHAPSKPLPFLDVFCDRGAFNLSQARRILERGRDLGFALKIHADEFESLGACSLAVELGAVSADHLVRTSPREIDQLGKSNTVAVSLPCTPFGLAESDYTPARAILEAGGTLAIASDINPGTAWCENMQFVIALACRYLRLTPAQAIIAATINAAAAIQRQDLIGSLEPGKQADLIILSVDDYRQLGYRFGTNLVDIVIKKGRVYRN